MKANLHVRHYGYTLGAALALATTVAFALTPVREGYADEHAIILAQATPMPTVAPVNDPAPGYPAMEAGVRRAAAEGPDALRRYVWRTRMIYNYYIADFMIVA